MAQNVDIAADLERVHGAITRALEVAATTSAAMKTNRPSSDE